MPGHDGLGLDDDNSRAPISPAATQPEPKQAITLAQARPFGASLVHRELPAKSEIFESETPAAGEGQVD